MVVLSDLYAPAILSDSYAFSESKTYYAPEHTDHDGYLEHIARLPVLSEPEAFGLHENANINKDLQEVEQLLGALMLTQSQDTSSTGKTRDELIGDVSSEILARLPANFDIEAVQRRHPPSYHDSLNTVLAQELTRFNTLLTVVCSPLALALQYTSCNMSSHFQEHDCLVVSRELEALLRF